MLRVSIHAGPINSMARFNQLAWCDIGYDKLAAVAQYKTVLFQSHQGASPQREIANYPRWSASLWDLVARALVLGLQPDETSGKEELPAVEPPDKGWAFAEKISVVIEHLSPTGHFRSALASAEISQVGRKRGTYVGHFDEHTMKRVVTKEFVFRPSFLRAGELVAHACAVRLTGELVLPPRPALCIPEIIEAEGLKQVALHTLVEPARTGFLRWLSAFSEPPAPHPGAPLGIAPETLYVKFLQEAI